MKKNITIGVMLIVIVCLAVAIVKVENQRYALFLGMCRHERTGVADTKCLARVETRTNPLWHLYYALTD